MLCCAQLRRVLAKMPKVHTRRQMPIASIGKAAGVGTDCQKFALQKYTFIWSQRLCNSSSTTAAHGCLLATG